MGCTAAAETSDSPGLGAHIVLEDRKIGPLVEDVGLQEMPGLRSSAGFGGNLVALFEGRVAVCAAGTLPGIADTACYTQDWKIGSSLVALQTAKFVQGDRQLQESKQQRGIVAEDAEAVD